MPFPQTLFISLLMLSAAYRTGTASERATKETDNPAKIETRIAIQGVCAWPNLQQLPDGTLLAIIYNQPNHGRWEGELDCWASSDQGQMWRFRGRVVQHQPGTNRMNCAVGFARNGDLVVLSSGYTNRIPNPLKPFAQPVKPRPGQRFLPTSVCRSSDGGRTWEVNEKFPAPPDTELGRKNHFVPFGNIMAARDGSHCASVYLKRDNGRARYLVRCRDDGRTWGEAMVLNPRGNETSILHLGDGRWLAASREFREKPDVHLELFMSSDDGKTWRRDGPLTLPLQVTGHLMRLQDGRILLSYGNRNWNNFGVDVRYSDDEGATWGPPIRVADAVDADCGYPSGVQLSDGRVVTAYYTRISEDFHYEMRVAIWSPGAFATAGRPVVNR